MKKDAWLRMRDTRGAWSLASRKNDGGGGGEEWTERCGRRRERERERCTEKMNLRG
jgi:hypothetical protein